MFQNLRAKVVALQSTLLILNAHSSFFFGVTVMLLMFFLCHKVPGSKKPCKSKQQPTRGVLSIQFPFNSLLNALL